MLKLYFDPLHAGKPEISRTEFLASGEACQFACERSMMIMIGKADLQQQQQNVPSRLYVERPAV